MFEVTRDHIKIFDPVNKFTYECKISFKGCLYNQNSIAFCEENKPATCRVLVYKNGKLAELAKDTEARILYANASLDMIVFIIKGGYTDYDFMDLYVYENEEVKLFCKRVNITGTRFFIVNNNITMIYLVESEKKDTNGDTLWDLFETDLKGSINLIESGVENYAAFLTKENKIKYIISKWSSIKIKQYAGYFDEDYSWLVIKNNKLSKEFPMGHYGDHCASPSGALVLMKSEEKIHDGDPEDIYFLKRKTISSVCLINTDTFEMVLVDKSETKNLFRLHLSKEYVDINLAQSNGIRITPELIAQYPHYFRIQEHKIKSNYPYSVYFSKTSSKTYYIARELAEKADKFLTIESIYPLDDSQNYLASYIVENKKDFEALTTLLGSMVYETSNIKFKVFGIDVLELARCCMGEFSSGLNENVKNYEYMQNIISELKKFYRTDSSLQIREFLERDIIDKYNIKMQGYSGNKSIYNKLYKDIEHNLINQNRLPAKWQSEQDLYRLISSLYPDAIFHYNEKWISPQHLDIFVPQINCAFEYQGQQHYFKIDHFGGDDEFRKRIELDKRKKGKCAENNITLVEWHYNEPITKMILMQKLKNVGKI
jgi:hypothetical protein